MRVSTYIRGVWQDYKAWRRGERRIGSYGARGRIWEKRNLVVPPSTATRVNTKTVYKTLARVIRADGRPDEHYNLSEDMKLLPDEFHALKGDTNHG